jgi:hypothetical protein
VYTVNTLQDLGIANGVDNTNGQIKSAQHQDTGIVTLRSAIQAANNNPGGNAINLSVAGTYQIQLVPATTNETDNLAGEFALLPEGNLTIQNASGGTATVDGGGIARVFDVNPAAENTTAFTVTIAGLTIRNGSATASNADPGSGSGIRARCAASIVLNNDVLTGNTAAADGGSASFGVLLVGTTPGGQTVTATVTSPDANPAGVTAGAPVSVLAPSPSPVAAVPPSTFIPNATIPSGAVLPANVVTVFVETVKKHGKKFLEVIAVNTTGEFILGRLALSGLSVKQYGQLLGLSAKQLQNVPTFEGSPAIDIFLPPGGQQTMQVPAAAFTPLVVAGL